MEVLTTNRNKQKLVHNDYLYYKQKNVKIGIRWVCVHKGLCNGSLTTDDGINVVLKFSDHNHEGNTDLISAERAKCIMKNTAKQNYDIPSRIFALNVIPLSKESKQLIPKEDSMKRTLRRVRSNIYPKIVKIDDIILEGTQWSTTGGELNPEPFLFYDNKNNNNRIIIFSSKTCREMLSETKIIYMDGTFSTCPSEFYQVYIIHASINNLIIPVMYALLQRKNKDTYIELLSAIRDQFLSLSIISIDFEQSVIQAIKEVFHDEVSVQLCYYHLNQSIWRKIQDLGLSIKYKEDKNFRSAIKMIPALAFLPTNTVKRAMSILFKSLKTFEELEDILVYFDSTYVNGTYKSISTEYGAIRLVRRPPIFSPYMWNVYNATKKGYSRTNNVSEGFNNKFQNIVRIRHPNIYIFIESLQMCNASAVTALLKKKNEIINMPKTNHYENKIKQHCIEFKCNSDNDILCFLKRISDLI